APSSTNRRLSASPCPRAPPVMSATFPASRSPIRPLRSLARLPVVRLRNCMQLVPLSSRFGVEVLDVHLSEAPSSSQVDDLRSALDEHKLLLVRGQPVDTDTHRAFARLFGFSIADLDGSDERSVTNRRTLGAQALAFHTDHIYTAFGSSPALSLCALEV